MKKTTSSYQELILKNKQWVADQIGQDPGFFETLSQGQTPPFLYIGCSDSRKPINVITQTGPGELFIQRNIANQVALTDMNLLSVLEYGVEVLKIEHVIICGHHGCAGVEAAMEDNVAGLIENWVSPIRDIYLSNREELAALSDKEQRTNRLSEMNVVVQAKNLCKTSILKKAFRSGVYPRIHGWMFHMRSGLIHDLTLPVDEWKQEGILPSIYQT